MFDTHCHLNFLAFKGKVREVIERACKADVNNFIVPGTDIETSQKAVEIAQKYKSVYAAVGIHPHHVSKYLSSNIKCQNPNIKNDLKKVELLLKNNKVVAIGEIGLDYHIYNKTKYPHYQIKPQFVEKQKKLLADQIKLAINYNKSLILHNREAKKDFLTVLDKNWDKKLEWRTVFHCCEPDEELLSYAVKHHIYIGVDGDVTYPPAGGKKQEFVKKIPLDHLVLETDSPYLLPRLDRKARQAEPLRSEIKPRPVNEPKNISIIAEFIADIMNVPINRLIDTTTDNAKRLLSV